MYQDRKRIDYLEWEADRQLAETIHQQISSLIDRNSLALDSLEGIVTFKGPGSFTGLRIGISVANGLASGLNIPIVSSAGAKWLQSGLKRMISGQNERIIVPEYGALPHITLPKK